MIGAGIAGLVAGHRLAEAGHVADVYERWPGLGGQAATLDVGSGHRLERYYHHLFTSDRHIAALYDELGMPDELEWRNRRSLSSPTGDRGRSPARSTCFGSGRCRSHRACAWGSPC